MNQYGLLTEIRWYRKNCQMGRHLHRYENLLNREFTAGKPTQKWVTDVSSIYIRQGVRYLSIIRDLFDHILRPSILCSIQSRQAVRKEAAAAEVQLHSGQGFQYTSLVYFNLTKEYTLRILCQDAVVVIITQWRKTSSLILKAECNNLNKPKTFALARELIDEYIHFYNYERNQMKTRLTSLEKRRQAT